MRSLTVALMLAVVIGLPAVALGVCCDDPFADDDVDGDVDQDDFARFQECFTGSGWDVYVAGHCKCFDRNNDSKVDENDFAAFTNCVTGPEVPWTQAGTPACVP